MSTPLRNEASLVACKRVLAKLYKTHSNMTLALKIEILEALGYGYEPEMVGALLSKSAHLTDEGVIQYDIVAGEAEEYS